MDVVYFILFLGVLIFFHEFGHFLVARLVGVTVVRFSIGFGPKLLGFKRGDTEYWISALPLGGYVKFLGDDPEDPPPDREKQRGFLTTAVWRRVLIVLAGPVFNLILPILVLVPVYLAQTEVPPATLGTVARGGPAWDAGLRPGDKVVEIDGAPVSAFWQLQDAVSADPGGTLSFVVQRGGARLSFDVTPAAIEDPDLREVGWTSMIGQIRVSPDAIRPVVVVAADSPAARAGVKDFDAILSVDGVKPYSFDQVATALRAASERPVHLVVAATSDGSETPGKPRDVTVGPLPAGVATGLSDGSAVVSRIAVGSPAERAGLKPGDRLVTVDGRPVPDWLFLMQDLERNRDEDHLLDVDRAGQRVELHLNLLNPRYVPGAAVAKYEFGADVRRAVERPELVENDLPVRFAVARAMARTAKIFDITVGGLWQLVTGRRSVKEMGGPIMIYQIAANAGERGLTDFLGAMAWLSMSLGVLNLLPVPVLDGGHLVIFAIEAVRRRPVGRRGRQLATWFGLAFLIMLMMLVFVNDFERTWGALSGLGSPR